MLINNRTGESWLSTDQMGFAIVLRIMWVLSNHKSEEYGPITVPVVLSINILDEFCLISDQMGLI